MLTHHRAQLAKLKRCNCSRGQRMVVAHLRFASAARTAWHSYAHDQNLHITSGVALIGTSDSTIVRATADQTVYTQHGEEHWHGAAPERFMKHFAMLGWRLRSRARLS